MEFHTIKSVKPITNMIVEVVFNNGECKKYDVKQLIKKYEIFKDLEK